MAVLPAVPVRKKMANNSASDKVRAPWINNFSRGRSASGQSRIDILTSLWVYAASWPSGDKPSTLYHMGSLNNKRVLLGITGSIAAYKCADLSRRLRDAGAEVRVVMTEAAEAFVTPLTMQAVSGHPVHRYLLDSDSESAMGHIELARWADIILIAPASTNFLAKLASGRADDLLSTLCSATSAPLALAPAMNQQMWHNRATQDNLKILQQRQVLILGPAEGDQACGEHGLGRMLEPVELVEGIKGCFASGALDGLNVMVTAGPTWEAIDAVRGLTNRSSGKMGYAMAQAAVEAGATVTLVSGPVRIPAPDRVQTIDVTSAQDMFDAVNQHIETISIFIAVAAVSDYRAAHPATEKIKKTGDAITLELVENPDILATVASRPQAPFTVGFAAETNNLEDYAQEKLLQKNVDLIAANQVGGSDSGFDVDTNSLLVIGRNYKTLLEKQYKTRLARKLITIIAEQYHAKNTTQNSRPQAR